MDQLLSALPSLVGVIEKAGTLGVLILIVGVLGMEVARLRKENTRTYGQRDKALLMVVKLKTVLESHDIKVDLSDIRDLIPDA